MDYKVVEIFDSIEGEGKRAGATASFIRLAGCNLRCSYCDTTYAMDGEYQILSIPEILEKLDKAHIKRATITGGEPLQVYDVKSLIHELLYVGYEVNIETNGSVDISPYLHFERMFFTIDYKLPSSGMAEKMLPSNFNQLRSWDVLKFVVGSDNDVKHMISVLQKLESKPQIYVGAVYGQYDLQKLAKHIIEKPELRNVTMQLQFHKIIWNPNERGV